MELIYQYDIAPVIPAPTADSPVVPDSGVEFFPVVEPNGLVVARAAREYCHSGAKPLHPVVHLHIIDRFSRIYLQKRPLSKKIQPGKWDTAVGGHIDLGESVEQALLRETREELGITLHETPQKIAHYVFESERERELVFVHKIIHDGLITPSEELDGGSFWPISSIKENIGKNLFTPNFESEFLKFESELKA